MLTSCCRSISLRALLFFSVALLAATHPLLGQSPLWTRKELRVSKNTIIPCWWGQDPAPSHGSLRRVLILATPVRSSDSETEAPSVLAPWEPLIREGLIVIHRSIALGPTSPADWSQFLRSLRLHCSPLEGRFDLLAPEAEVLEVIDHIEANPFEYRLVQMRVTMPAVVSRALSTRSKFTSLLVMTPGGTEHHDSMTKLEHDLRSHGHHVASAVSSKEDHPSRLYAEHMHRGLARKEAHRPAHRVLDDLHDAATRADYDRYFRCYAKEGVFLGTDATERWTTDQFRTWARPYFQRDSAWIFTVLDRKLHSTPDGLTWWFEETLGSRNYGECRGTGILVTEDDGLRIAQYNLTVPIPNTLLSAVAERIVGFDHQTPSQRTYWISRHAEKEDGRDPELSAAGKARAARLAAHLKFVPLDGIYSSEWKRTQETADAVSAQRGLSTTVVEARAPGRLLAEIRRSAAQQVLIVGHSNTVPDLIRLLGVSEVPQLTEEDYGDLFQVIVTPEGAQLTRIRL